MKSRYLEVTFRQGRPLAAYLYLPRRSGDTSARTVQMGDGINVDYAADGRPIGVEFTAPSRASLAAVNRVLGAIGQELAQGDELRPMAA